MKFILHQEDLTIGDLEKSCELITQCSHHQSAEDTHLWPELFLGGYPLQDMVLDKSFIEKYTESLEKLNQFFISADGAKSTHLFGGLKYELNERGLPEKIYNSAYVGVPGLGVKEVYQKRLLPNYDIFDEQKYYTAGKENGYVTINNKTFAIIICEDMWHSTTHDLDPVDELVKEVKGNKISLSGIINLSASPYAVDKQDSRKSRALEISQALGVPFIYVNALGLHDEILFDGQSFYCDGSNFSQAGAFTTQALTVEYTKTQKNQSRKTTFQAKNTWEDLFAPRIDPEAKILEPLSSKQMDDLTSALMFSINSYLRKVGMKKITIALSGGIDSALVLALAHLTNLKYKFGEVEAIYMPGQFSASLSYDLSKQMCETLGIKFYNFPIKFIHQNLRHSFSENIGQSLEGLADENIQSRIRGTILYARSNQENSLVLNTSNKSELSVGYSTLYGDSVGAISPLGDLYKSEVFSLAKYLNNSCHQIIGSDIIPDGIITRPPSAELRADQKDEDSLPPYERLDFYLEGLLSHQVTQEDLEKILPFKEEITKTVHLLKRSEYKRFQFCPVIKLKNKSFGFGRRVPILKR